MIGHTISIRSAGVIAAQGSGSLSPRLPTHSAAVAARAVSPVRSCPEDSCDEAVIGIDYTSHDGVVVRVVVRTCIRTILMGKPAETLSVNARSLTAPGLRFPPVASIVRSPFSTLFYAVHRPDILKGCMLESGSFPMLRKVCELVEDLLANGFAEVVGGGKGSHRKFVHDRYLWALTLSGQAGDDAKPCQEKQIRKALEQIHEDD